ncbi:hypothetical protein CCO03_05725 [Comamonas serinivorans]|uniref:Uncharacterized protein n=1 Tax=Comamonas serinivorans TaxID=1082851 RepID=A0A1Y0ESN2_9BURK|nr:hypothetical protein CCO03_05725 [Comamonas serinivorans]
MERALHAVPSQCAICERWPTRRLCAACIHQHAQPEPRCIQCALHLADAGRLHPHAHEPGSATPGWRCGECLLHPPPWQRGLAAVSYAPPWTALIAAFKFRGDAGLARPLAQLMRQVPGAAECIAHADVVVPVPLTPQGLLERGYNQTALLARQLAPRKLRHGLLRLQDGAPQHRLNRRERLASMRSAFAPAPHTRLTGLRVLLVDDVLTTGATATAASQCLLDAGAASVNVLVLARTGRHGPAATAAP